MTRTFCDRCGKETTDESLYDVKKAVGDYAVGGVFVKVDDGTDFVDLCNECQQSLNKFIQEFMKKDEH